MDRVTVDLLDDDYEPDEKEDSGPDLAHEPTNVGVRYLMGLGMSEMDARHLVAVAKGKAMRDARPALQPDAIDRSA
jgi:hypothetical protein